MGSIYITGRVTRAGISECRLTVELLESFFHGEYGIAIVVVRILVVIEIFFDIDLDAIECIDYIAKRREVDHHIVLY